MAGQYEKAITIKQAIDSINLRHYLLPAIQRKFVWSSSQICLLFDSIMRKKQYNYYRDQLLSFDNEDVPHLPMGQKDIGEFIRGGTFQKKDFMDAGVGCIHYGQIYTYYGTYTKKTKTHISAALAKKCKKAQKGNLIIATTSENDEDVCKAVA